MEEASLLNGACRIKFGAVRLGNIQDFVRTTMDPVMAKSGIHTLSQEMGITLRKLEDIGAAPVCADGAVAGNAAAILPGVDAILVSKSGKQAGAFNPEEDVAIVSNFCVDGWCAEFYSPSEAVRPTSDTPLHWATLVNARRALMPLGSSYDVACSYFHTFSACPQVTLHGHALQTIQEAEALGLPISHEETLFSTPEDTTALVRLFVDFPYPSHKTYIRNGHGFITLHSSFAAALDEFITKWKTMIGLKSSS